MAPLHLYVAWQQDGEIPNQSPPEPAPTTLIARRITSQLARYKKLKKKHVALQRWTDPAQYEAIANEVADRNYSRHYTNLLQFCAGVRILGSRSISHADVRKAQSFWSQAFQSWAQMSHLLFPYAHLILHIPDGALRNGPIPSTWLYASERNNHTLSRFNTNGRGKGEMEATMMRGWVKTSLVQDLVRVV